MSIELLDVNFSYSGQPERHVINIPGWSIPSGSLVFLHGPSGSGKSTLMGLLCGILLPQTGQVRLFGHNINQMNSRQRDHFRACYIGYVFQQFNLIPYLSAVDNLHLACHFSKRLQKRDIAYESRQLLSSLHIDERDSTRATRDLSVGQRQRVAIARALINKPKIMIADEPTSSLDQHNRDVFMTLLMTIVKQQRMTLLFVSHDMALAEYFERVEAIEDIQQGAVIR